VAVAWSRSKNGDRRAAAGGRRLSETRERDVYVTVNTRTPGVSRTGGGELDAVTCVSLSTAVRLHVHVRAKTVGFVFVLVDTWITVKPTGKP
jgi:hypothetical protein